MKLTLIGGGGVRSPLFVMTLLRWQERVRVDELWLLDTDPARLEQFGALNEALVRRAGSPFRLEITTDPRRALEGADHVVTAVRVGQERGRVLDERIALRHGVIGQETTGPGGFAMAMRSIPAILGCPAAAPAQPQCLAVQLHQPGRAGEPGPARDGFERAIGICDGANQGQASIAAWAGVPPAYPGGGLRPQSPFLTRRAWLDGQDQRPAPWPTTPSARAPAHVRPAAGAPDGHAPERVPLTITTTPKRPWPPCRAKPSPAARRLKPSTAG